MKNVVHSEGWNKLFQIFYHQAINDLIGMDLIPEPKIIIAALHACRRINDYSITTRFLEAIKYKTAHHQGVIYPYILQVGCAAIAEVSDIKYIL